MLKPGPTSSSTARENTKLKQNNSKTSYYNNPHFFHEKSKRVSLNDETINKSIHKPKNSVSNLPVSLSSRHPIVSDKVRKSTLLY